MVALTLLVTAAACPRTAAHLTTGAIHLVTDIPSTATVASGSSP